MCLGINSGCTGYVDALYLASKLIKKNQDVIIVTSDTYSKYIKDNDRSTKVLFGDAASVSYLKYSNNDKKGLIDIFICNFRSDMFHDPN